MDIKSVIVEVEVGVIVALITDLRVWLFKAFAVPVFRDLREKMKRKYLLMKGQEDTTRSQ